MFRNAMRAGNGGGGGGKSGGGKGYEPPQEYDDRVTCDFCGRKFAEAAAKRHTPHCEEKSKKAAMKAGPLPRRR
jgi:hypothetical protein